jgi:hypothetical protein
MAEVFLSYAREDRARAEQVANGLAAAGVDVFWDNEIPPGQTWADYIEDKLTHCKALIVLWSGESTKSQWVREEARLGRDKGVLIPVMIDASTPPFGFGEVQAANLSDWNGAEDDVHWRRFVDAVKRFTSAVARPAAPQMPPPPPPRAAPAPQPIAAPAAAEKKGVPVWVWVAGGVTAALVLIVVVFAAMLPDPAPQSAAVAPAQTAPVQPQAQPGVSPDQEAQAIILHQLQQAQVAAAQQGFQIVGQPASGALQRGQSWNVPAELYAGYDYAVLGVCDRDCNDLDLVMYDANGAAIAQDTTTSNQPLLSIQPSYNGAYTIQVQMYNCSIEPCYYAIALYARPLQ